MTLKEQFKAHMKRPICFLSNQELNNQNVDVKCQLGKIMQQNMKALGGHLNLAVGLKVRPKIMLLNQQMKRSILEDQGEKETLQKL